MEKRACDTYNKKYLTRKDEKNERHHGTLPVRRCTQHATAAGLPRSMDGRTRFSRRTRIRPFRSRYRRNCHWTCGVLVRKRMSRSRGPYSPSARGRRVPTDGVVYLAKNGFLDNSTVQTERPIELASCKQGGTLFRCIVNDKLIDPIKLLNEKFFDKTYVEYVINAMSKTHETLIIRLVTITGHSSAIKIVIDAGVQLCKGVAITAALHGHIDCLHFLIQNDCPVSKQILSMYCF
ncbi:Hypothetical protein CINCED_3A015330 [Cinara cedri]|uniref:Ankyrin repeat-containing domain n=1 Tax=Cinara cedri TaxID=506608 RepID=A0A5E4NNU6_9HEMI|nr:Hypothetical protein CINCED_3A015330 [Cinara cedri]